MRALNKSFIQIGFFDRTVMESCNMQYCFVVFTNKFFCKGGTQQRATLAASFSSCSATRVFFFRSSSCAAPTLYINRHSRKWMLEKRVYTWNKTIIQRFFLVSFFVVQSISHHINVYLERSNFS